MIDTIDAGHITKVLDNKFAAPAYLTMFEVRSVTGFTINERYADAVIFSMWPSNGLTITGCEIKISRQDLKRELEHPEKSEAIKKYCDYWWLCVPVHMKTEDMDIPTDWGVMAFTKQSFSVRQKPTKLTPEPLTTSFLFSCMRSANRRGLDKVAGFIRSIR